MMHDYKNLTTDISAMVNRYRLFIIDKECSDRRDNKKDQFVNLESWGKRK